MPEDGVTRRRILAGGCSLALAGALAGCGAEPVMGSEKHITALREVRVNSPIKFTYPDEEVAILIDVGRSVEGGVGPGQSIIAYSGLCQHLGCPVDYASARKQFVCPCHGSIYDALRGGSTVEGPSPSQLPRILLKVSQRRVFAIGVQGGLVYGRASNRA